MATNLLGMDIAGSYAQGSQMGTQNFSLAMQMDEKERQRKKEKDIKTLK